MKWELVLFCYSQLWYVSFWWPVFPSSWVLIMLRSARVASPFLLVEIFICDFWCQPYNYIPCILESFLSLSSCQIIEYVSQEDPKCTGRHVYVMHEIERRAGAKPWCSVWHVCTNGETEAQSSVTSELVYIWELAYHRSQVVTWEGAGQMGDKPGVTDGL